MACPFQLVLAFRFHKVTSRSRCWCASCDELVLERKGRPVEWHDKLKFSKQARTRLLAAAKVLPEIEKWAGEHW